MVAANGLGSGVGASGAGGKDVLPAPVGGGVGVLSVEGLGEMNLAEPVGDVLFVEFSDVDEVVPESLVAGIGQQRSSILLTFAVSDRDVAEIEVDILDSQSEHSRMRIPVP